MYDLLLIKPSKDLEAEIWRYRQECLDFGEKRVTGSCGIHTFQNYDTWLETALSIEKEKLSIDYVHASTFFSYRKSDGKIIGSIQLRHFLTLELEKHGGHIGYEICPSERGKGYAIQQLFLILEKAREMHIPKVMISCEKNNVPSAKTIVRCGGVLEREENYKNKIYQIYWIELSSI